MAVAAFSEAPLNMFAPSTKRILKRFFLRFVLARKVEPLVTPCRFVLNQSGEAFKPMSCIGWTDSQIIPSGYFPPPNEGSQFISRTDSHHKDFVILSTGQMTWHRGADHLIKAAKLLKLWGVNCRFIITQNGPYFERNRQQALAHRLPIEFVGFVDSGMLNHYYESCSLFVAAGIEEPWGIRVNDALHCGAVIGVSRGMGVSSIVDTYGCGFSYDAYEYYQLAWRIAELVRSKKLYLTAAESVKQASTACMPEPAASATIQLLRERGLIS